MSLFDKVQPAAPTASVTPIANAPTAPQFEEAAPRKKREAPEAWGNVGMTIVGVDHYFQNKFFRVEQKQKLDAKVLEAYEAAYNEHMKTEGNTAQNFPKVRVPAWIEIVPANGATSQEITGEIQFMDVAK